MILATVTVVALASNTNIDPESHETLIPSKSELQNGKSGYVDSEWHWIIPPTFVWAGAFDENGFAPVQMGIKACGFIDRAGRFVISPRFENVRPFSKDGLALAQLNGRWGVIDRTGQFVIQPQFEELKGFSEGGLAPAKTKDAWGYINRKGEFEIQPQFDSAMEFRVGIASVHVNGKWSDINTKGEIQQTVPFSRQQSSYGANGLAAVELDRSKWGFVDTEMNVVIPAQFDWVRNFAPVGLAQVTRDHRSGYINAKGEIVIALIYEQAESFGRNGLARVKQDGKWGFVNQYGAFVIPAQFEQIFGDFGNDGLAIVKLGGKWGSIDEKGTFVIPAKFDGLSHFDDKEVAVAGNGDYRGLINRAGKFIAPPEFTNIHKFAGQGLAAVTKGGRWGYINRDGKVVVDFKYRTAGDFDADGIAEVRGSCTWGYINTKGEFVQMLHSAFPSPGCENESARQDSRDGSRVEAVSSPAPGVRKGTSLPAGTEWLVGNYQGTITTGGETFKTVLRCRSESGCELDTENKDDEGLHLRHTDQITSLTAVQDLLQQVRLSIAYAREHRTPKSSSAEFATIQEQLRPFLESQVDVNDCMDLNRGGHGASLVCRLRNSPWKTPAILFLGASLSCGRGFCGYVIYPLMLQ